MQLEKVPAASVGAYAGAGAASWSWLSDNCMQLPSRGCQGGASTSIVDPDGSRASDASINDMRVLEPEPAVHNALSSLLSRSIISQHIAERFRGTDWGVPGGEHPCRPSSAQQALCKADCGHLSHTSIRAPEADHCAVLGPQLSLEVCDQLRIVCHGLQQS